MNNHNLINKENTSPILLVLFNRPQYLNKSIESINKILPEKLYIHIDGPRNKTDDKKIQEINELIKQLDKQIDIKILSQETNLGCRLGMVSAINWLFEHEDFGIILEDDCIPNQTFYNFCNKLLIDQKDNQSIFMISGDNGGEIVPEKSFENSTAITLPIPLIWGWATWKDRWQDYEYNKLPLNFFFLYKKLKQFKFFEKFFIINYLKKLKNYKDLNTWDIHLFYSLIISSRECIVPRLNLIKNIGFDDNATHTKELTFRSNAKTYDLDLEDILIKKSNKLLNSKILYLLQSNLESSFVHRNSLFLVRLSYLKGRLKYFSISLKSKILKITYSKNQ